MSLSLSALGGSSILSFNFSIPSRTPSPYTKSDSVDYRRCYLFVEVNPRVLLCWSRSYVEFCGKTSLDGLSAFFYSFG